jgi:predicted membrane protein
MSFNRFFCGIILILAAAFLVMSRVLGFCIDIPVWKIILGIVIIYIFCISIKAREIFGILVSLAVFYLLFAKHLELYQLPAVPLIGAAILLSIGLYIMFGSRKRKKRCFITKIDTDGDIEFSNETMNMDGDKVCRRVKFGKSVVHLHSKNLKAAEFSCFAGEMQVFFSDAQMDPGGASVKVECALSSMKLFIPKTWSVNKDIDVTIGNSDEKNLHGETEGPILQLTGTVKIGEVEIIYV